MGKRTGLYERHIAAGARIVDFGGWDMPLHYGSQIDEHHAVRRAAGVFDVSHMTVIDVSGATPEHGCGWFSPMISTGSGRSEKACTAAC